MKNNYKITFLLICATTPCVAHATHIYRSFGTSSTVSSPGGTLTINATTGVATFSGAQPGKMGVGDAISYDTDGDTSTYDAVCFVSARASSTSYTCQNARGGLPTASTAATSKWIVHRAYLTLADLSTSWQASGFIENTSIPAAVRDFDNFNVRDLAANAESWHLAVYNDTAAASGALDGNWTHDPTDTPSYGFTNSSSSYGVRIYAPFLSTEVGTRQRHAGTWDDGKATLSFDDNAEISWAGGASHITIEGLQLTGPTDAATHANVQGILIGQALAAGEVTIRENLFRNFGDSSHTGGSPDYTEGRGIYLQAGTGGGGTSQVFKIYNNVFFSTLGTQNYGVGISAESHGRQYIYNNTFYNLKWGMFGDTANSSGNGQIHLKNNLTQSCGTGIFLSAASAWTATASNVTSDTTSPDGASFRSLTATFAGAGSSNFHLDSADTGAIGRGTDLSADAGLAFSTDYEGTLRETPWSAGADQPASASLAITHASGYDYGNIALNSATDRTFTVTNSGDLDADNVAETISASLDAPFDYKGGTYPGTGGTCPSSITSGQACTIVITFTPTAAGAASDTISLDYESAGTPKTATRAIQGTGVNVASLAITADSSANWGNRAVGSTTSLLFTVTNSGAGSATVVAEDGSAALAAPFSFTGGSFPGSGGGTCTATIAAGATCKIRLSFAPSGLGAAADSVVLSYNNGLAASTATLALQGTGANIGALEMSAGALDLGVAMVGSSPAQGTLTLSNPGSLPATLISASGSSPLPPFGYQGGSYPGTGGTCAATLAAGATCTIRVEFTPVSSGAASTALTIGYDDGIGAQTLSLTLSGTGLADTIAPGAPEGISIE